MKLILRCCFISLLSLYPFISTFSYTNRMTTVYLHNCKSSSRMITAYVFNGNFSKQNINPYTLRQYTLLAQSKNIGPGETVAVQCSSQRKRQCVVGAENGDFREVRPDNVLYFYHYLKDDRGITKLSFDSSLCGKNYKPVTKYPLTR